EWRSVVCRLERACEVVAFEARVFFFSSRRRHTRSYGDWSSDVCSSDLKQFTAASILLLAEQGKLSLDDELKKFLPDYPTQGNRVTVRRLLNHTSGIKGFTELPEFGEFQM